jgi:hypothetical protein
VIPRTPGAVTFPNAPGVVLASESKSNPRRGLLGFCDPSLSRIATLERDLIRERVCAGLRNARAKGRKLGRPRREVDVRRAQALRASGHSWRQISEQLEVDPSVVYRAVRAQQGGAA